MTVRHEPETFFSIIVLWYGLPRAFFVKVIRTVKRLPSLSPRRAKSMRHDDGFRFLKPSCAGLAGAFADARLAGTQAVAFASLPS